MKICCASRAWRPTTIGLRSESSMRCPELLEDPVPGVHSILGMLLITDKARAKEILR